MKNIKWDFNGSKIQKTCIFIGGVLCAFILALLQGLGVGNSLTSNLAIIIELPFLILGTCSIKGKNVDQYIAEIKAKRKAKLKEKRREKWLFK